MNLTTTGSPFGGFPLGGFTFGTALGAPASGAMGQGFALALGAAGLGNAPRIGAGAANDLIPAFANDSAALRLGANPLVRAQAAPSVTLAQLLAAGSKAPADAAQPAPPANPVAADAPVQAPRDAGAQPERARLPAQAEAPIPAEAPSTDTAEPVIATAAPVEPEAEPRTAAPPRPVTPDAAMTVAADANEPIERPAGEDQPPQLDLPGVGRPKSGIVATPPVAIPAKQRKEPVIDSVPPLLPADPQPVPLPAQPLIVPVAGTATPPAATPERKTDGGRGGTATPGALAQPAAPAANDAALPAARPHEAASAASDQAFSSDAGQSADAARAEPRASGQAPAPAQSFAAHVQSAAPAHVPAPTAPPAEPMVPARPGQLGHALGVEIARKVEAGEDTLRVRMNPAELGRVEVTLAFDDDGRLHATMRAESHRALELLRQDAPDLGRALDSAGIRADTQSFRFESRGDGNGGAGGQSGQHQPRGQGQQSFRDEPEAPTPAYRPIRGDGQVDLLA